jgi:two-component system response regulator MprA
MRLLLVEDDRMIGESLQRTLRLEGYAVDWVRDASAADGTLASERFDLVLLDLGLPRGGAGVGPGDGLEVLQALRARRDATPVIVLTARDARGDRVAGLDAGADDYLVKPFALDELLARLRALLRRTHMSDDDAVLRVGDLSLDPARRQVRRAERDLELTKTEFDLLELLMYNAGIVLTREQIYERIWGFDFETSSKSLDVYISYLRRKTEEAGEARLIHTVRGVGYTARPT